MFLSQTHRMLNSVLIFFSNLPDHSEHSNGNVISGALPPSPVSSIPLHIKWFHGASQDWRWSTTICPFLFSTISLFPLFGIAKQGKHTLVIFALHKLRKKKRLEMLLFQGTTWVFVQWWLLYVSIDVPKPNGSEFLIFSCGINSRTQDHSDFILGLNSSSWLYTASIWCLIPFIL